MMIRKALKLAGRSVLAPALCVLAVSGETRPAATATERDETLLVSRASAPDGVPGNHSSFFPEVSGNGRFVAFYSLASNLHPDDLDGRHDGLVRDLRTDEVTLVSRANGVEGVKGNGDSLLPAISADGRFIVFESAADNLHSDDADVNRDVLVRDSQTHETILVSRAGGADGAKGNFQSFNASISSDGHFAVFHSNATNLHPDDSEFNRDVFVRDLQTDETILVSRASGADGDKGNAPSGTTRCPSSLSADGRFVAFQSEATNLHPDDPDDGEDSCSPLRVRGFSSRVSPGVRNRPHRNARSGRRTVEIERNTRIAMIARGSSNAKRSTTRPSQEMVTSRMFSSGSSSECRLMLPMFTLSSSDGGGGADGLPPQPPPPQEPSTPARSDRSKTQRRF